MKPISKEQKGKLQEYEAFFNNQVDNKTFIYFESDLLNPNFVDHIIDLGLQGYTIIKG